LELVNVQGINDNDKDGSEDGVEIDEEMILRRDYRLERV
jgi:hypothetical protein